MKNKLVNELIEYFLKENSKYYIDIPDTYEEKRLLLRGLINLREPKFIPDKILEKESKLLQLELKDKQITDANDFKERIVLWRGDITTLKCDAIVNACNEYLLGCFIPNHFCIDNQIHTYAGINLRLKCNEIMKGNTLETGKAILTPGYNLPSKYVIHTVGPQISKKVSSKDEENLKACYINCLELAKKNNIKTLVFPCISTGVYGYPKKNASKIACSTVKEYLDINKGYFNSIIFNVFTDDDYKIYQENLNRINL